MVDELIDICDENGHILGAAIPKSQVHQKGFWHHTVHIWIYNSKNEILLQQRTSTKEIFPNVWDIAVAGHISSNETPIHAALREIKEEIGLVVLPNKLTELSIIKKNYTIPEKKIIDNEIHHVFALKFSGKLDSLTLQYEEVNDLKHISFNDFENELKNPEMNSKYYPRGNYYFQILNKLKGIL